MRRIQLQRRLSQVRAAVGPCSYRVRAEFGPHSVVHRPTLLSRSGRTLAELVSPSPRIRPASRTPNRPLCTPMGASSYGDLGGIRPLIWRRFGDSCWVCLMLDEGDTAPDADLAANGSLPQRYTIFALTSAFCRCPRTPQLAASRLPRAGHSPNTCTGPVGSVLPYRRDHGYQSATRPPSSLPPLVRRPEQHTYRERP